MMSSDDGQSVDAIVGAYHFIVAHPQEKRSQKLLNEMMRILRYRKMPGLVSAVFIFQNLLYEKSPIMQKKNLSALDECLLILADSLQVSEACGEEYREILRGVDYVNSYLERLAGENRLLCRFSKDALEPVLNRYCRDYRGLLVNLYEPVVTNALGRVLLGKDLDALTISPEDCGRLEWQLTHLSRTGLEELLSRTAERLSDQLDLRDRRERAYLRACARGLAPRIALVRDTGGLPGIFLPG